MREFLSAQISKVDCMNVSGRAKDDEVVFETKQHLKRKRKRQMWKCGDGGWVSFRRIIRVLYCFLGCLSSSDVRSSFFLCIAAHQILLHLESLLLLSTLPLYNHPGLSHPHLYLSANIKTLYNLLLVKHSKMPIIGGNKYSWYNKISYPSSPLSSRNSFDWHTLKASLAFVATEPHTASITTGFWSKCVNQVVHLIGVPTRSKPVHVPTISITSPCCRSTFPNGRCHQQREQAPRRSWSPRQCHLQESWG